MTLTGPPAYPPSSSFPDRALAASNLEALARRQPALAARIGRATWGKDIQAVSSHAGPPILIKRGISLHSRHDPAAESGSLIGRQLRDIDPCRAVPFFFGFGAGYHVKAAAEIFPRVVVYEPDPGVLSAAFHLADGPPCRSASLS